MVWWPACGREGSLYTRNGYAASKLGGNQLRVCNPITEPFLLNEGTRVISQRFLMADARDL